jgi:hypothetical protein
MFFIPQTLDYLIDNQAFVGFNILQYFIKTIYRQLVQLPNENGFFFHDVRSIM